MSLKLDLGCSDRALDGYVSVDLVPPADQIVDLESLPWPWETSSVDEIRAHDIFEHLAPYIPGYPDNVVLRYPKIAVMNEAYRVLRPGGILDLFVPTTDGRGAFQDPTHKTFWTPNDLWYFCDAHAEWRRFHVAYGITANFRIVEASHRQYGRTEDNVWKLKAVLEAVK